MLLEFLKIGSMYQIKDLYCIFDNSDIKYTIPDTSFNNELPYTSKDIRKSILDKTHLWDNVILKVLDIKEENNRITEVKFYMPTDMISYEIKVLEPFIVHFPDKNYGSVISDFGSSVLDDLLVLCKISNWKSRKNLRNKITNEILPNSCNDMGAIEIDICFKSPKVPISIKDELAGCFTCVGTYGINPYMKPKPLLEEMYFSSDFDINMNIQNDIINSFNAYGIDIKVQE